MPHPYRPHRRRHSLERFRFARTLDADAAATARPLDADAATARASYAETDADAATMVATATNLETSLRELVRACALTEAS